MEPSLGCNSNTVGSVSTGCPFQKSPEIKALICPAICACNNKAMLSKSGAELKQQCVSQLLTLYDDAQGNQSAVKAEVNYDMTKSPPVPIMSRTNPLKPSGYLLARTDEIPNFKPGKGMVRRPDVVIVKDTSKQPTQDNLRSVVEIKFPPDKLSPEQEADYNIIAGDAGLTTLSPKECNCPEKKPKPIPEPLLVPAPQPEPVRNYKPGVIEVIGLSLALVALALDDAAPVGATQADDILIPGIIARLGMAF